MVPSTARYLTKSCNADYDDPLSVPIVPVQVHGSVAKRSQVPDNIVKPHSLLLLSTWKIYPLSRVGARSRILRLIFSSLDLKN